MQEFEQCIEEGIVRVRVIGLIDFDESVRYVMENAKCWKSMPILWDFSSAEMHHWSADVLARQVRESGSKAEPQALGKMALYSSNPLHHSMLEFIRSLRSARGNGAEARVFKFKEDALDWLRLDTK